MFWKVENRLEKDKVFKDELKIIMLKYIWLVVCYYFRNRYKIYVYIVLIYFGMIIFLIYGISIREI